MAVGADIALSAVWRPVETVAWLMMPSCVPVRWKYGGGEKLLKNLCSRSLGYEVSYLRLDLIGGRKLELIEPNV